MLAGTPSRLPTTAGELLPPELTARLDRLDVVSRKVFAGKLQGERRSKRRGKSVEFEEHRDYVPGDDLRHIDWNVYARFDRLVLKIFEEEEDLSLILVLDASASMLAGSPLKLLTAARIAMALGYIGLARNNRVSCTVIGTLGGDRRLASVRGRSSIQRLGGFMIDAAFEPARRAASDRAGDGGPPVARARDWNESMRAIAASREGKGVLVVISDLLVPPPPLGGYQTGLRLLSAPSGAQSSGAAFDVCCVQVLSPGELDPSKEGRSAGGGAEDDAPPALLGDLSLTDVETGRSAEVTVTPALLDAYRASVKRFVGGAAEFCTARGMTHLLVPSDADVAALVLDTLRRRGLLA